MPYDRELRRAEMSLTNFANRTLGLGALLDIPIRAATIGTFALTAAFAGAGYAAVKLAADYETIGVSLEVMTGSAEKGQRLLNEINSMAVESPFRSSGLQAAAKELSAFGIETQQIMPTLRALGDVASGVATDNLDEMMGRIVLAFGQVRTAGRLMGPEARQFVQAGVPIYDYLAKVFDKPVEMMKQMTEEGKVGFNDVVQAFNLMTAEGGRFFGMMDKQSDTVRGRWSAFIETVEITLRDVGLAAFKGLGLKEFLEDLRKMAETARGGGMVQFFQEVRSTIIEIVNTAKMISYWIDRAYRATRDWWQAVDGSSQEIREIATTAAILLGTIGAIAAAWAALSLLSNPFVMAFATLVGISMLLNEMEAFKGFGDSFSKGFREAEDDFGRMVQSFKTAMKAEDWETAGKIVGLGFRMGFRIGWEGLVLELKLSLVDLVQWFIKTLVSVMIGSINNGPIGKALFEIEKAALGEKEAENRDLQRRAKLADVTDDIQKEFDKVRHALRILGEADLKKELEPLRAELKNLTIGADASMQRKQQRDWEAAHPGWDLVIKAQKEFSKDHVGQMVAEMEKLEKLWGVKEGDWNEDQQAHFAVILENLRVQFEAANIAVAGFVNGANASQAALKLTREQMSPRIAYRPEVLALGGDIRREMAKEQDKGIGFGAGQFSSFMKTQDMLKEGYYGPAREWLGAQTMPGPVGDAFREGVPKPQFSEEQYRFGLFREYQNLRRWVGGGQGERLPPVAMQGSAEAQDIINRTQMQSSDRGAEMLATLKAAEALQAQQKQIMDEDTKKLDEIIRQLQGRDY